MDGGCREGEDWRFWVGSRRGPLPPLELVAHGRGPGRAGVPVAMVWPTPLGVDEYAAAGRSLAVPRLGCPACGTAMGLWGWYERDVRVGSVWRLLIRRQRCPACAVTHAVLPSFVVHGRLDAVEVIATAVSMLGGGRRGVRRVAMFVDVAHTTAREWWRRFRTRAELLAVGFIRFCVAVGDVAPRLAGGPARVALAAISWAWRAARRRFGAKVGRRWRFANAVVGGQWLSTNTDPPWSAA